MICPQDQARNDPDFLFLWSLDFNLIFCKNSRMRTQFMVFRKSFIPNLAIVAIIFSQSIVLSLAQDIEQIRAAREEIVELMKANQFQRSVAKRAEALEMAKKSLTAHEKALGPDSPDLIPYLKITGQLQMATSKEESVKYYRRALIIAEKSYGSESAQAADCLDALVAPTSALANGKFSPEANSLQDHAYEIRKKLFGEHHPETAKSLIRRSQHVAKENGAPEAQKQLIEALEIFEQQLKPEDYKEYKSILEILPILYASISLAGGDGISVQGFQKRVSELMARLSSQKVEEDPGVIKIEAGIALANHDQRNAIKLYEHALTIEENKYGSNSISIIPTLSTLGGFYFSSGAYDKSDQLLDRSLRIADSDTNYDARVGLLAEFAHHLDFIGDYEKALPLRKRILEILRRDKKQNNVNVSDALIDLGHEYQFLGEDNEATQCFQQALEIPRPNERDGIAIVLTKRGLADLYFQLHRYKEAESLYQQFVDYLQKERLNVPGFMDVYLRQLGIIAQRNGDFKKAADYFKRADAISENSNGYDIALLAIDQSQDGLSMAQRYDDERLKTAHLILAYASERQRLAFAQSFDPYTLWVALRRPTEITRSVLRYKGLVLDSLLEERRLTEVANQPAQKELYEQLRLAKSNLAQAQYNATIVKMPPAQPAAFDDSLVTTVESLEKQIALHVSGLGKTRQALEVLPDQVQAALPPNSVLIEMILYHHYLGSRQFEMRYGAVVLASGTTPQWISLGAAADLEKTIKLYQRSVRGKTDESTLKEASDELFTKVWKPLEQSLPAKTTTILLSPDGLLHAVSFAALINPAGHFLAEEYSFSYVSSGRDILNNLSQENSSSHSMAIFADPSFRIFHSDSRSNELVSAGAIRATYKRDMQRFIQLTELPGTEREANALAAKASAEGWKADLRTGIDASKASLAKLESPRILHLATHGFFLPSARSSDAAPDGFTLPENPMLRSGLALAGAQDTLDAWKSGTVPPIVNDGLVTAEDIGSLELNGTWIVTLSACETGNGDIRAGEGVMGLQRGFRQAGAQNLLMTLWPISDETTVMMMMDFYDRALKGKNAPQALADTQREWLVKLHEEKGLFQAVNLAGPFVMSSQGCNH